MITFWHNPRCSKSREALALLEEQGAEVTVRRYLDDAPDEAELRAAQALRGGALIDMVRTSEPKFRELGLTRTASANALYAAMAEHPRLIERPLAMNESRAVVGRPPETVLELLKD